MFDTLLALLGAFQGASAEPAATAIDRLRFSDDLPVLGPIQVQLTDNYVPAAGTRFDVIVTGEFDFSGTVFNPANLIFGQGGSGNVLFDFKEASLSEGMEWVVGMNPDGLSPTVVPEPGVLALLITGTLGLSIGFTCRRRRSH